jgi:hypothetical protein
VCRGIIAVGCEIHAEHLKWILSLWVLNAVVRKSTSEYSLAFKWLINVSVPFSYLFLHYSTRCFMFCLPCCISKFSCNETNFMHYYIQLIKSLFCVHCFCYCSLFLLLFICYPNWGFSLLFPQLWGKCQGIIRKMGHGRHLPIFLSVYYFPISVLCVLFMCDVLLPPGVNRITSYHIIPLQFNVCTVHC